MEDQDDATKLLSLPLATPDYAPHKSESRILSLLVNEFQYRWAVHEGYEDDFFPITFWRTSAMTQEELDEYQGRPQAMSDRYIPSQVLDIFYGRENPHTRETAASYRATHRIPTLSVYIVPNGEAKINNNDSTLTTAAALTPDMVAQQGVMFMLQNIPCRFYKIAPDNFEGMVVQDNVAFSNGEQLATAAAVDMLFPGRPSLIVDGGTTLNLSATESEVCNENPAALLSKGRQQAAERGTSQRTTWNKITKRCQTVSISTKVTSMHLQTGALPEIDMKKIQHVLQELEDKKEVLQLFGTSTEQAILGCILQESTLLIRSVIKKWALTEKSTSGGGASAAAKIRPLVCITGMESNVLTKLIGPQASLLCEIGEDPSFAWSEGDSGLSEESSCLSIARPEGGKMELEVATRRNLAFHGIRRVFMLLCETKEKTLVSEIDHLREDLMGCRIAKYFGDELFRGQIVSYQKDPHSPQSIDHTLFLVRYDDGDGEEVPVRELYDALLLYVKLWEDQSSYPYAGSELEAVRKKREDSREAAVNLRKLSPTIHRLAGPPPAPAVGESNPERAKKSSAGASEFHEAERAGGKSVSPIPDPKAAAAASSNKRPAPKDLPEEETKKTKTRDSGSKASDFVNQRLAKYFDEVLFYGTVQKADGQFWQVLYDDGDMEDLEKKELQQCLKLYKKFESGDPNPVLPK